MTDQDWTVEFGDIKAIGVHTKLHIIKEKGEVVDTELLTAVTLVARLSPDQIREIAKLQMAPETVNVKLTTAQIPMFGKEPA